MQHTDWIKSSFASVFATSYLLASCGLGGEVDLGDDSTELRQGEGAYEPCNDKTCGDRCTLCDPTDSDCVETDDLKFCDANADCTGERPTCDAGVECGTVICEAGQVCCNESCGICTEPGGACEDMYCGGEGSGNEDPCAGKACGDECSNCAPGEPCRTVLEFCDADGVCGGDAACDGGEYDPCEGKSCGEACSLCDPADRSCVETTDLKACDAGGRCVSGGVPECDKGACQAGDTRTDVCGNVCDCVEGRWVCTDIGCVPCGGPSDDPCPEGEYCAFSAGQECGATGERAYCVPRPDACTLELSPVCGCDGNTYGNACGAASAGTGVLIEGECP